MIGCTKDGMHVFLEQVNTNLTPRISYFGKYNKLLLSIPSGWPLASLTESEVPHCAQCPVQSPLIIEIGGNIKCASFFYLAQVIESPQKKQSTRLSMESTDLKLSESRYVQKTECLKEKHKTTQINLKNKPNPEKRFKHVIFFGGIGPPGTS